MQAITVVVIDDHPLFRQGVVDALSLEVDLRVVGQASSGREGLDLLRRVRPSVAVVDVNMPGMTGLELIQQAQTERLPTRILLLSGYTDSATQQRARQVGAAGFYTKEIHPDRLAGLIREAARQSWSAGVREAAAPAERRVEQPAETEQLSGREREILMWVARGMSNKEIAAQLGISQQTVKNHVTAVLRKINVADRTQAAILALTRGWVDPAR